MQGFGWANSIGQAMAGKKSAGCCRITEDNIGLLVLCNTQAAIGLLLDMEPNKKTWCMTSVAQVLKMYLMCDAPHRPKQCHTTYTHFCKLAFERLLVTQKWFSHWFKKLVCLEQHMCCKYWKTFQWPSPLTKQASTWVSWNKKLPHTQQWKKTCQIQSKKKEKGEPDKDWKLLGEKCSQHLLQ